MKLLFLLLLLNVELRILKVKPRKERWESVDSMLTSVKCCPKTSDPVAPGFCLSAKPGPNWQQWPRHCPEGGWLQITSDEDAPVLLGSCHPDARPPSRRPPKLGFPHTWACRRDMGVHTGALVLAHTAGRILGKAPMLTQTPFPECPLPIMGGGDGTDMAG